MREILFRGKRIDNGELVDGFYHFAKWYLNGNFTGKITYYIRPIGAQDAYQVDPETVGQYTGLTDKNGKKIFDGDIIKDDWGKIYKVIFTTDSCGFMVECTVAPNEYEKGHYRLGNAWCNTISVIGNIHDNPELLEVSGDEYNVNHKKNLS